MRRGSVWEDEPVIRKGQGEPRGRLAGCVNLKESGSLELEQEGGSRSEVLEQRTE